MSRRLIAIILLVPITVFSQPRHFLRAQDTPKPGTTPGRKVKKTDAEWAKLLTRNQFLVTRRKETEPAFSGRYATSHAKGIYACVCCGADLFSSTAKFDSGTGWPSFWKPIDAKNIETAADYEQAEARVEVMCRDCGAHLGHVFQDGPPPTGLRFCINSLSLKLVPPTSTAKTPAKAKGKAKAKSKTDDTPAETDPASKEEKPSAETKGDEKTPPEKP
jgi:peptide-methionine (R)-S-oxide reductase